ncbi:hypothetical protein JTE90_018331 [Oedothorax gibbosus]|uniref:Uncharacterized protein n=1 Tax=Oedothorax gibbosus TaxID=931172 RepID=A0AAV6TGJ7_9ARAC|nr:hypothetical protein JTE90_018331 [Oedothorax gibbosus]
MRQTEISLCGMNTSVLQVPKKEDVCRRSPLLNGLLDKKAPKRDILFHALVENGIQAEPTGYVPRTGPVMDRIRETLRAFSILTFLLR